MPYLLHPISKEELIEKFKAIERQGWIPDNNRDTNDGAMGNLLEELLGVDENNLPIPNSSEWELKTQKDDTSSLVTLCHMEPSPRSLSLIPNLLLPQYGWPHKEAGKKYPENELSFRATLSAGRWTRGFSVELNEQENRVQIIFNPNMVKPQDAEWLETVKDRVKDINKIEVTPYWGFNDLFAKARTKLLNCFLVIGEQKRINGIKHYHYYKVYKLSNLEFWKFLHAIGRGELQVEFDARTGHNHGAKFRINQAILPTLYENVEIVVDMPKLRDNDTLI